MNTYFLEFFARCPVNGIRVKYALTVDSREALMVERLIDVVEGIGSGLHEQIADELFASFGGRQTLVAHHHGVDITTTRSSSYASR